MRLHILIFDFSASAKTNLSCIVDKIPNLQLLNSRFQVDYRAMFSSNRNIVGFEQYSRDNNP